MLFLFETNTCININVSKLDLMLNELMRNRTEFSLSSSIKLISNLLLTVN